MERFVHKAGVSIRVHQHLNASLDFSIILTCEGFHHNTHRPHHIVTDMRSADSFACLAFKECKDLAQEVETALKKYAVYNHPKYGKIYAFEVDGFGNHHLMDDANVPSLLAMPYLGDVNVNDPIYQNTRRFVWSEDNPYIL